MSESQKPGWRERLRDRRARRKQGALDRAARRGRTLQDRNEDYRATNPGSSSYGEYKSWRR